MAIFRKSHLPLGFPVWRLPVVSHPVSIRVTLAYFYFYLGVITTVLPLLWVLCENMVILSLTEEARSETPLTILKILLFSPHTQSLLCYLSPYCFVAPLSFHASWFWHGSWESMCFHIPCNLLLYVFSSLFYFFSEIEWNQPQTLQLPCGAYTRQGEERLALCIGPLWIAAICVWAIWEKKD